MRTLKKALCLVLVLAMVLTLSVSAFAVDKAADYKDYAKVENKEAVDVLTAIGVLNGNDDGSFGPEGNFTRAQAAKIICYMTLGKTVADALTAGATQFNDVPATHWAAKYIQYCANEGIIVGVGEGKFAPDSTLSAYAWAKMLLCALGYDASAENMTGTGWEIQVTKLAMNAGVASAEDLTSAFNRDAAAKMAFNTLKATCVEYTGGSKIEINGATITSGAVRSDVKNTNTVETIKSDDRMQFAEQHFSKLTLTDNGNGTHSWSKGVNDKIGTYGDSNNVVATYTGPVSAAKLYTDGVKAADTVKLYVNGEATGSTIELKVVRGDNATKNFTDYNGATITLLANAEGKVNTVNVVMPYLAKVDKVYAETAARDAYTKLTVYMNSSTGTAAYVAGDSFAKGDYVLYAPAGNVLATDSANPDAEAVVLEPAASFVSTVASYNTTKGTFVADDTTYTYSSAAKVKVGSAVSDLDVKNGTTYVFFKDLNGTIIGSKVDTEGTSTLNYVYVSASQSTAATDNLLNAGSDAFKVKVTYLDGKTEVVDYALYTAANDIAGTTIAKGDTYYVAPNGTKVELATSSAPITAGLYSYTTNSEGNITLSDRLTSTGAVPTTAKLVGGSISVTKGSAQVKAGDLLVGYATTATPLVLTKGTTVTTYEGYTKFPTATYANSDTMKVVYVTTGAIGSSSTQTITNILVIGGTAAVDTTPDSYAVYAGVGDVTSDGAYYNFYVEGSVKSYLISDSSAVTSFTSKGIYGLTLDNDGKAVVTDVNTASLTVTAVTDAYVAGTTAVYYVNGEYSAHDISATASSAWVDVDIAVGDTVTIVYKTDATAHVNNILAAFVTAHAAD